MDIISVCGLPARYFPDSQFHAIRGGLNFLFDLKVFQLTHSLSHSEFLLWATGVFQILFKSSFFWVGRFVHGVVTSNEYAVQSLLLGLKHLILMALQPIFVALSDINTNSCYFDFQLF